MALTLPRRRMILAQSLLLLCSLAFISQVLGSPAPGAYPLLNSQQENKAKRSAPVHFPLRKRGQLGILGPNGRRIVTVEELADIRRKDLERVTYIQRRKTQSHEKKSGWETVGLTSYGGDSFYYMSMQMGTPPQTIDIAVDTGSS